MHSDTDFTAEEQAVLADLEKQEQQAFAQQASDQANEQAGNGNQPGQANQQQQAAAQDAQAGNAAADQQGQAAADQGTGGEQAPAGEAPAKKPGDLRNALRASRRAEHAAREAERAAREENERLQRQIEDIKSGKQAPDASTALTEAELTELEVDFPQQAAAIRKLNATVQQLTAKASATPAAPAPASAARQDDFVPPVLVPKLQEVVDDIPDLLDMQNDPDQTRWQLAIDADQLLSVSPKWKDKPLLERLAEAARMANDHTGVAAPAAQTSSQQATQTGAADQLEKARKRIEQAPAPHPTSISDIRGGASPTSKSTPDYSRMSDDDIMASLG